MLGRIGVPGTSWSWRHCKGSRDFRGFPNGPWTSAIFGLGVGGGRGPQSRCPHFCPQKDPLNPVAHKTQNPYQRDTFWRYNSYYSGNPHILDISYCILCVILSPKCRLSGGTECNSHQGLIMPRKKRGEFWVGGLYQSQGGEGGRVSCFSLALVSHPMKSLWEVT